MKNRNRTRTPLPNVYGYGIRTVEVSKGLSERERIRLANAEIAAGIAAEQQAAFLKTPEGQRQQQIQQKIREASMLAGDINAALGARLRKGEIVSDSTILGGYEMREMEEIESDPALDRQLYFSKELDETFAQFCSLLDQRGIDLKSAEATAILVQFMMANVFKAGIAITPENWFRSLERLWQLGIVDSTMVTGLDKPATADQVNEPAETEAQRQKRIAAEIERGNDELHWVNAEMRRDWQSMYREFAEFMQATYSADVLQQRIVDFVVKWAEKWNKSLANPTHLNELRRALDYNQFFGPRGHLLTADERTARALEDTPLTNATFEQKQDIVSRLNALAGKK